MKVEIEGVGFLDIFLILTYCYYQFILLNLVSFSTATALILRSSIRKSNYLGLPR